MIVNKNKYSTYEKSKPLMVEITTTEKPTITTKFQKNQDGIYESKANSGTKEATLLCGGQIQYDELLGDRAKFGNEYDFLPNFELMKTCLSKGDLVIGNLATMASSHYLSTEMIKSDYLSNQYYSNARPEYIKALKHAGFDCLAAAAPCNLDAGVIGISDTEDCLQRNGLLPIGIGEEKNKIFNINDLKIGILSYTLKCRDLDKMITEEGANTILNIYSKEQAGKDIANLKAQNADFILVYLNCGNKESTIKVDERESKGKEIAELGADYVICTVPRYVSRAITHETADHRHVKIATSLGDFMTGRVYEEDYLSVMMRIKIYKTQDGSIEICDDAIPLKHFELYKGYNLPIVPAVEAFSTDYNSKDFKDVRKNLRKKLHKGTPIADDQIVTINKHTVSQYTYRELFEVLGVKPSLRIRMKLDLDSKVGLIATRKPELKKGCVALMVEHTGYVKDKYQITLEDAIKKKASLIIGNETTPLIPSIKIDGPLKEESYKIFGNIIDKRHPITVAITGTAGKTTTTSLASCVFENQYKTLHIKGNFNQFYTCCSVIQKLSSKHEAYVQEVHGGSFNAASGVSKLIKPDIAIITSIGEGHLLDLGSLENIIKAKLEIVHGLKKTGVLILNNDNEHLKGVEIEGVRILRYGIEDPNCDYYATDIHNLGERVTFKVHCAAGVFDAMLNLQGLHNISNALAVFAAGIEANIPPHKIVAGLAQFKADSDKQNLMTFNGYDMLVDTYSATPISMESAMQTLDSFPVKEGARKIAVLGDIPALGKQAAVKHKEVGENIAKYDFDVMLCVGEFSKAFADAAVAAGKEAYFYSDREAFNRKLAETIKPGDFILFKSGTRSHLKEETIYPLFGLIDKQ